jgi:two-component system response regulator
MLNKTVLVVERDPEVAQQILEFFRSHQFRNPIDVVHSKSEALDYIFGTREFGDLKSPRTPGLILLDLLTNKTRDVRILRPLQSYLRTQNIPIIILTSSADQEHEVTEYHIGAVGFIRKPLEFTHFIEVIQHMGMEWKSGSDVATTG